jgi:plasmid maintenance system antidote protein VapI
MKIVATLPPMNLQTRYDLRMAERAIAADLAAIETFKQDAA